MEEGCGMKVEREGGRVRVIMPAAEGEIAFRKEAGWLFRTFVVGALGVMAVGAWVAVGILAASALRAFPVNDALGVVVAVGLLIVDAMPALGAGIMTWFFLTGFYEQRVEFVVEGKFVTEVVRRGPWVWRRRTRREGITEIVVSAPGKMAQRELRKPLGERRTTVWIISGEKRRKIQCTYPHRVAAALVEVLRSESGAGVAALDWVDPKVVNKDADEGGERGISLRRTVAGVLIEREHGLRVGKLMKMDMFRAMVWQLIILAVANAGLGFVLPAAVWADMGWLVRAASVFYGALGCMCMAALAWGQCVWESFEVTEEGLVATVHGVFFRRRREWKRGEIAAVRVAQRVEDKNVVRNVVELVKSDGQRPVLASGGMKYAQRLATVLRRELGVGAEPAVEVGADASDSRWHLEDERERPAKMGMAIVEGRGRVLAHKRWRGRKISYKIAAALGGAMLMGAGVLLAAELPRAVKAEDVEGMWAGAAGLTVYGLFLLGLVLYARTYRWVLVVSEGKLTCSKGSAFGRSVRVWQRGEVEAIRTAPQWKNYSKSPAHVVVVVNGEEQKVVGGEAPAARYLATVLRRRWGVGAQGRGEAQETPRLEGRG